MPPVRANAALLLMVLIWGVNFAVAKDALATLSPLVFNELRFPMAALVVYLALRLRGPIPLPDRADVWKVVGLGVLGNVFYQQFFIFGLANTRAGIASVLLAGTPIVTTLLSSFAGHERIRPLVWAGVAASSFTTYTEPSARRRCRTPATRLSTITDSHVLPDPRPLELPPQDPALLG